MYIGLSATGPAEAHELRLLGNRVLLVAPRARQAQVSVGYRNLDLGYQSAIPAFASSLGLPAARASALADALTTARSVTSRPAPADVSTLAGCDARFRLPCYAISVVFRGGADASNRHRNGRVPVPSLEDDV